MSAGEPENAATVMRLMLAHMVVLNKRVKSAMVLDRLDMELGLPMSWATAPDAHRDAHGPLGIKKTLSPLSWNGWGGGHPQAVIWGIQEA